MTHPFIIAMLIWIALGSLAYGITYAHLQREWPELADKNKSSDRLTAFYDFLLGPAGLLTAIVESDGAKHGLKFF